MLNWFKLFYSWSSWYSWEYKIGNNCLIGGKSGISGHLMVGDNVYIGGQSGVLKNIKSNEK
jgi:UDP-3-O-[3-hydroxymyristoyl] glucosamine N-acyltransferase